VFITALPQNTAEVERTFSHLNNNKSKPKDCLAVCTLEVGESRHVRATFHDVERSYNMGQFFCSNFATSVLGLWHALWKFTEQNNYNLKSYMNFFIRHSSGSKDPMRRDP